MSTHKKNIALLKQYIGKNDTIQIKVINNNPIFIFDFKTDEHIINLDDLMQAKKYRLMIGLNSVVFIIGSHEVVDEKYFDEKEMLLKSGKIYVITESYDFFNVDEELDRKIDIYFSEKDRERYKEILDLV